MVDASNLKLRIKYSGDNNVEVEALSNSTVGDLKKKIEEKIKVEASSQKLIFKGN